jgi:hypothetical protein
MLHNATSFYLNVAVCNIQEFQIFVREVGERSRNGARM